MATEEHIIRGRQDIEAYVVCDVFAESNRLQPPIGTLYLLTDALCCDGDSLQNMETLPQCLRFVLRNGNFNFFLRGKKLTKPRYKWENDNGLSRETDVFLEIETLTDGSVKNIDVLEYNPEKEYESKAVTASGRFDSFGQCTEYLTRTAATKSNWFPVYVEETGVYCAGKMHAMPRFAIRKETYLLYIANKSSASGIKYCHYQRQRTDEFGEDCVQLGQLALFGEGQDMFSNFFFYTCPQ